MQPLFALLRFALCTDAQPSDTLAQADWTVLYTQAQRQGIIGVLLSGIERLPLTMQPPKPILLQWVTDCMEIRRRNERSFKHALRLCRGLEQKGLPCCILKGQGNALMYPDPFLRIPGDIDVWIDAPRQRIIDLAEEGWQAKEGTPIPSPVRYHHVELPPIGQDIVEAHFTPIFVHSPWHNRRLQVWIGAQRTEQFAHSVALPISLKPGLSPRITVPTPQFNAVYLVAHAHKHLFEEGFGLRQLLDCYYALAHPALTDADRHEAAKVLRRCGMGRFTRALMHALGEACGLPRRQMLCEPLSEEGKWLLREMLIGGNFGFHDQRFARDDNANALQRLFHKCLRSTRAAAHFPLEALCTPLFSVWQGFSRIVHKGDRGLARIAPADSGISSSEARAFTGEST